MGTVCAEVHGRSCVVVFVCCCFLYRVFQCIEVLGKSAL